MWCLTCLQYLPCFAVEHFEEVWDVTTWRAVFCWESENNEFKYISDKSTTSHTAISVKARINHCFHYERIHFLVSKLFISVPFIFYHVLVECCWCLRCPRQLRQKCSPNYPGWLKHASPLEVSDPQKSQFLSLWKVKIKYEH